MNNLEEMRHTLSHVLAAAVRELYPDAKFGIGPAIDDGFYYDIDFGKAKISDTDLPKIEKKMRGIIKRNLPMTRRVSSRDEALKWAKDNKQDYKVELIKELPEDEEISFYDMEDMDLKKHFITTGRPFQEGTVEVFQQKLKVTPAFRLHFSYCSIGNVHIPL